MREKAQKKSITGMICVEMKLYLKERSLKIYCKESNTQFAKYY